MQQMVKIRKPKARVVRIWNYHDMEHYLEAKYKRNFGDYATHRHSVVSTSSHNVHHRMQWEETRYPRIAEFRKNPLPNSGINQEGLDFYKTPKGIRFEQDVRKAYSEAPDGEAKEIPFWCFWHFIVDSFEISNGVTRQVNWLSLADCGEEWQKEICMLFVKEFGDKDMEVEFSW